MAYPLFLSERNIRIWLFRLSVLSCKKEATQHPALSRKKNKRERSKEKDKREKKEGNKTNKKKKHKQKGKRRKIKKTAVVPLLIIFIS